MFQKNLSIQHTMLGHCAVLDFSTDTIFRLITRGEGGREELGEEKLTGADRVLPQEVTPCSSSCGPG